MFVWVNRKNLINTSQKKKSKFIFMSNFGFRQQMLSNICYFSVLLPLKNPGNIITLSDFYVL